MWAPLVQKIRHTHCATSSFTGICFRGVQGHLNGELPWAHCDECVDMDMAKLVGMLVCAHGHGQTCGYVSVWI